MRLSGVLRNEIFRDFAFAFNDGINIVVGSNGSGKTTLMKMICDLQQNKGHILLDEKKLRSDSCTYFFSGDNLGEADMSIRETILYYVNFKSDRVYKRYNEIMGVLGLKVHEEVLVKNASEGMKQKMSIVICLLNRRDIVLLDEPFNYLDEESCSSLIHYLQCYQKELNNIIIISSNDLKVIKEFNNFHLLDLNKPE